MTGDGGYQLDLRGLVSPFVHLKVIQRFHELEPGDTLRLVHIDPESVHDLMAILRHYPLVLGEAQEHEGSYRLHITKNPSTPL
jgi:TusA-related sulfurtransferase